jgi:hypothetical protein
MTFVLQELTVVEGPDLLLVDRRLVELEAIEISAHRELGGRHLVAD